MARELAPFLARAAIDEVETQHDAVGRLLDLVATRDEPHVADALSAVYGLLGSPRLAVVSKACRGLVQLLACAPPAIDIGETSNQVVKALEDAAAREEQQQHHHHHHHHHPLQKDGKRYHGGGIMQALAKCLVATLRAQIMREAQQGLSGEAREGERGGRGGGGGGGGQGLIAMLLGMKRGLLYPALSHEATSFLGASNTEPREVVHVVGALASAILLQPEHANLRGGFMLKLSTASATASDAVKCCLVILQAEMLGFCAVHTPAHADIAAGWCRALAHAAISLETDAAWERASRAVTGVATLMLAEFGERGFSTAPLLASLQSMVAADAPCLADEVAFLGVLALQSPCVDERGELLGIIGRTVSAMPLHDCDLRAQAWSLETLVYPVVSMAAAGNEAAAAALPPLETALETVVSRQARAGGEAGEPRAHPHRVSGIKPLRYSSTVALGVERLSAMDGDEKALESTCKGLRRRADEFRRSGSDDAGAGKREAAAKLEAAFCLLTPLLLRSQGTAVCAVAYATVVSVVQAVPTLGVRLLPFVLYAIRRLGGAGRQASGGVHSLLQILPELGLHKIAAKPVAGVIQALARAPQGAVRGVGLRLAARLIQVNARTFNQLQPLLVATPADHVPPSPPEPEESRICRAAGMLDVCTTEPELGLECVRPLQAFLADPSGAVTALALRAIAALIRSDCLDFDAALRIVTKKGKVAHTGRDGSDSDGDPRVVESLAQVCGASAEAATIAAAEAAEEDSEDSDEGDGPGWGMGNAVEILLEEKIGCNPDEAVRSTVYAAVDHHLPALLMAETGQEADEDAAALAPRVRAFLGQAMTSDPSVVARASLQDAASTVLITESADPSTWLSPKRAGASRGAGGKAQKPPGPSNRLLATLPTPEIILQTFHRDDSSCQGLAGAVLWCYPVPTAVDTMIRDLGELAVGGLVLCPWQRAATPLGLQRFVRRLFAACLAFESSKDCDGAGCAVAAVQTCRQAIEGLRGAPRGLIAVASASLVSCIPASFAHVVTEETDLSVERLQALSTDRTSTLLDGEELYPLCSAMVARALPVTAKKEMANALEAMESLHDDMARAFDQDDPSSATASPLTSNEGLAFWSCVAIGVASEWSVRHPTVPEAKSTVLRAVRRLLVGVGRAVRSDHVVAIAEASFEDAAGRAMEEEHTEVVPWNNIDVGQVLRDGGSKIGLPTSARGSRCLALFLGLASALPGLRATGLHRELRQVFHIVRVFQEAGACGAALCLPTAASECLSCGLIDSPLILNCLRSLSLVLDGATTSSSSERVPAQDACLGAAGLVVACEGRVLLPSGFAESMFERLQKAAAHRRGADSGTRVTSLLALASMVGCPLLGPGEFAPRCSRVSSFTSRRMVEKMLQTVQETMDGTSLRPKNAAARVWGCLSAIGQDERSIGDPILQEALGWTEGGNSGGGGSGAVSSDALSVAREGTLMNTILTRLQVVAMGVPNRGGGSSVGGGVEDAKQEGGLEVLQPALFAASAMACLEKCSTLRLPHTHMATVIGALFRGGYGSVVETRCVSLALALAGKEQSYSTWLRGLYRETLFGNVSSEARKHLVSVFSQVALKIPAETVGGLVEELWGTLTSTVLADLSGRSPSTRVASGYAETMSQAAMFLSGLSTIACTTTALAAAAAAAVGACCTQTILPSVLHAFTLHNDVDVVRPDAPEAGLWDALVSLLSCPPRQHVDGAIAFKPEASSRQTSGSHQTMRAYLISRLAGGEGAKSVSETTAGLGAVARWVTSKRTDGEASAAILPHAIEAFKRVDTLTERGSWLRMLLDTAGLPESCPARAIALVGGAAAGWDDGTVDGFIVMGDESGKYMVGRSVSHDRRGGSLLYSMGVAAPHAVAKIENSSPGLSVDVLTRLLRLSSLYRRLDEIDARGVRDMDEVRLGVESFIRGLRHAPPVLTGALSRQFASYAESIAEQEALS